MRYWLIALLFLISISFAVECAGYVETFDVRVLDPMWRPVAGADVSVKFDRGQSFGEQYFTTEPRDTNESGVARFTISNGNTTTRTIDCRIWVFTSLGSTSVEKIVYATQHGPTIDVFIPIYEVRFFVKDQHNTPLANAAVYFLNETKITGGDGRALFHSKNQTTEYVVSYLGGQEAGALAVAGDTNRDVVIPISSIAISVVDDKGEPLPAAISYLGETYQTNGTLALDVYELEAEITVEYGGVQKTEIVQPEESASIVVPFDIHAPIISGIQETLVGNRVRLSVNIIDEGEYASGVKPSLVKAKYRILPDGSWGTATAFTLGLNRYGIDFPPIDDGKIVEFVLEAQDYAGNKVSQEGRFVVQIEKPEDNESGNGQENGEKPQEFPLIYIIFGIIFIIIVFYIVKIFRQNSGRGG